MDWPAYSAEPQSLRQARLNNVPSRRENKCSLADPSSRHSLSVTRPLPFRATSDDARRAGGRRRARDRHVAELLVFPRNLRFLGEPMQARTGDALGEMTPVRRHERAGMRMRTRREHMSAGLDQLSPRGDDALPTGRRSRFDDDERVGGRLPQPLQDRLANLRRKFVQRVSQRDQIARRAIDSIGRRYPQCARRCAAPKLRARAASPQVRKTGLASMSKASARSGQQSAAAQSAVPGPAPISSAVFGAKSGRACLIAAKLARTAA